jgi:hypothetical protein
MVEAFINGQEQLRQSIQQNSPEDEVEFDMFIEEPALLAYLDVLRPIDKMVKEMQV